MLRHISKQLIIYLAALTSTAAYASSISVDEAKDVANEFFKTSGIQRLASPASLELIQTVSEKNVARYFVFNATDGHGFIIISADDCASPVLGYDTEGNFPANASSSSLGWYLSGLESEIGLASKFRKPMSAEKRMAAARAAARSGEIIELKTAAWSQEAPFNNAIPGRPLVGCVGTAMGIVMQHYQYPAHGTGSCSTSKGTVDFNVNYDWDNILREYPISGGYSAEQANAVATLLYHTSASIGTQWGYSGSSAYEVRVPAAMSQYFGYDPGISYKKRSEVATQAEFDAIIANEITNRRPVIFCGQDVTEGHAFVVDGYNPANGMIHINWGWRGQDGNSNGGWYLTTALNPTVSVSHNFNNLATIIYNIKPKEGDMQWSNIHITADGGQVGMGSDLTALSSGSKFTVRVGNLRNVSNTDFNGKIAVALFGADGSFKSLLSAEHNFDLTGMMGTKYMLFDGFMTFGGCALPSGAAATEGDVIRIATKENGSQDWLPVPGELLTVNELPAFRSEAEGFNINFTAENGVNVTGAPKVVRGFDYSFTVKPEDTAAEKVITVKANGFLLTPGADFSYTIKNVRADQNIEIIVRNASEVLAKRSVWVEEAGTLSSIFSDAEAAQVKNLTIFGSINATDFEYMRNAMNLEILDISSAYIAASGSDQACALPRNAFLNERSLKNVVLPSNLNRINNGAFRSSGITEIVIPAAVATYEYNVFLNCSSLRHIWVGREKAEFINWCVLQGTNKGAITLHVPSEAAKNNYANKENWKDLTNIVVEKYPAKTDFLYSVMDNADVKFDVVSTNPSQRYAKGTVAKFTAAHIAENDDRMEVYANNELLSPDASGEYTATINNNTIVHFNLVKPTAVSPHESTFMVLSDKGGTVGLLTDAVNVFPGKAFTIRANAFEVPAESSFFWAAALTDASGNIKEFISPVATWSSSISGDDLRMNVNCCVNQASVREGNKIRLVTSSNKKIWSLVGGKNENVVTSLDALNNQTPVYNINFPELENANVSGVVPTAVRGRDITITVSPKKAHDRITMAVNGTVIATEESSVKYSFIAKQDMDFTVDVITPPVPDEKVYNVKPGTGTEMVTWITKEAEDGRLPERVIIKGETNHTSLQTMMGKDIVRNRIKYLDISGTNITEIAVNTFGTSKKPNTTLETLILPAGVTKLVANSISYCTKLTEITLPKGITGKTDGKTYSMDGAAFEGSKLKVIYITSPITLTPKTGYGPLVDISHFNPYSYEGSRMAKYKLFNNDKIEPTVTVVVPKEDLHYYLKNDYATDTKYYNRYGSYNRYGNPWMLDGYNILDHKPVYSLNFDPSHMHIAEGFDIDNINFLGENVKVETISTAGKLFLNDDAPACVRIYDNDKLIENAIGADRSINILFHNPNKRDGLHGNHNVRAEYCYNVKFNLSSDIFTVEPKDNSNFSNSNPLAPEMTWLPEKSNVGFKINVNTGNSDIVSKVKLDGQVISADEDGYFTIDAINADHNVEVFAVPVNGATLSPEEFASIDVQEAVDITSIALTGQITPEILNIVKEKFESLEELDLSTMETALPENVFEGADKLRVVTLPEIETIPAGAFKGCTNLTTVTVPESVSGIGESAFYGCNSLESLTLTGITGIGANAFCGCSSMKTLYINAPNAGSTPNRLVRNTSQRVASYNAKAFEGLNPNCLIILGEGVEPPAVAENRVDGNYVATSIGEIEDVDASGNTITREGRIYTATDPFEFDSRYVFGSPVDVNITPGMVTLNIPVAEISNDGLGGWSSFIAPFDVDFGTDYEVIVADATYGFAANNGFLTAYTPALVRRVGLAKAGESTFAAAGSLISATPAKIESAGSDFTLTATLQNAKVDANTAYMLNGDGTGFIASEATDESQLPAETEGETNEEPAKATTAVAPFTVYAVSENGAPAIKIGNDVTTSVEGIEAGQGIRIYRRGEELLVESDRDFKAPVVDAAGRLIRIADIKAGTTVLEGLDKGKLYIIGNIKVVF